MTDRQQATTRKSPMAAHLALIVVSLLFGGNYVIAKFAFREVSPLTLMTFRVTGAALLLGALIRARGSRMADTPMTRRDIGELVVLSMLGVVINQLCFLEGLSRSSATNAGIMLMSVPVLTLAIALLMRRERATVHGIAGIAIGLVGALTLVLQRGNVALTPEAITGNVLLLTGSTSYALYLVLARGILARHEPLRVTAWTFYVAAVTMLPFGITGVVGAIGHGLTAVGWSSVTYVIIGATALPYLLNSWALARVAASTAAVYIFLQPLVAGSLGRVLLGERLAPGAAVAGALIVTGVALTVWRPKTT